MGFWIHLMRLAMDGVDDGTGMGSGGDRAATSTVRPAAYILNEKQIANV